MRRLLEFLRETVSSQSRPVRSYGPTTRLEWLYRADRPLEINTDVAPGEVAVRIARVSVDPPPAVPESLGKWITGPLDRSDTAPVISSDGPPADRNKTPDWLAQRAQIKAWLAKWNAWAEEDKRKRPLAELYLSVSRMRDESLAQPETVEVVLASGLLSATVASVDVDSHLLTQPVEINRDDETGDLLVSATAGSSPRFEDRQLLIGLDGLDNEASARLARKLGDTSSNPLAEAASAVLSDWASTAFRGVTYAPDRNLPPARRRGTLRESPALVLRRRTGFALVSYYDAMITALAAGVDVPLGLQQLVESVESTDRLEWLARPNPEGTSEALFPLAANHAQASIMDKLALDTGVVVEGPPGTGKTHTIANLMSALMAQGKRVLVTSEKSQALRVLRDKLPYELQDLCVSITDLSKGGSSELDRSVSIIGDRLADFDPAAAEQAIKDVSAKRYGAINRRYTLEERLSASRTAEAREQTFGPGFVGTLSGVIHMLDESAEKMGWVPGPVYTEAPPVYPHEFAEMAQLLVRREQHAEDRRDQTLPALADVLPSRAVVMRLCDRAGRRPRDTDHVDLPTSDLRRLGAVCRQLLGREDTLDPELRRLLDGVLFGKLGFVWTKAQNVRGLLDAAADSDAAVGSAEVSIDVVNRSVLHTFDAAARLYSEGRFDTLRWLRTPKEQSAVDALAVNATVDGQAARGGDAYRLVSEHLRAHLALDDATALITDLGVAVPPASTRASRINAVDSAWRRVEHVEDLLARIAAVANELGDRIDSFDAVKTIAARIDDSLASSDARDSLGELTAIADTFDAATGGANSTEALGVSDALRTGDAAQFVREVGAYSSAITEQSEQRSLDALLRTLDSAAPTLSTLVTQDRATDWFALAPSFADAWGWRWSRQAVEQQLSRPTDPNLDDEYDAVDDEIRHLTASLAAESAWRECLQRMTRREMQALRTYQDNVSHIGAGRGTSAQRYRAAARTAMQEAQSAVPAWIMPINQVLSSIPPEQNVFDVVIVDEASQAQLSSLFLMWLAPKIIVVGDDKQCAPDLVQQISTQRMSERVDSYLGDLPMHVRNNFTPRSSLFSLLRSRYNQRVRLKEHLRSMPEIIEWSSSQFYRDMPLVPVRQFGAERLQPLRSTFVTDADTSGSSATLVNQTEARQLVDQLCDCIADPDYEDMTFGVVVLQSSAQVELIRSLIAERIPAEQRDERRLRVGTPPDFQGDERDVIFLSMVVAPTSSTTALTKELWQRRFNVAATRARDQLWLFHSVSTDDVSAIDLRASLLSYVQASPTVPVAAMPEVRELGVLHRDFASMTAQRVFIALRNLGYHVNPSIEVNELHLDLVVTGAATKLAIECDDERVRSAEATTTRLRREMDLRRCDWTFARIRASDFAADPDRALAPVIEMLDALGILPGEVENTADTAGGHWRPVALDADSPDDADDDIVDTEQPLVAPTVDTVVAPLPTVIEEKHKVRSSTMPEAEREPGEPRPPKFDGSTAIRVDSRYAPPRRTVPSARPSKPVTARPTPAAMPKRAHLRNAPVAPVSNAPTGIGIETLPADVQASLAALPAAGMGTARVIAVAAARLGSPLTVRRCALVTGLTSIEAAQLLADLQLTRKLVRRQRRDGVAEWVRPEDAAS